MMKNLNPLTESDIDEVVNQILSSNSTDDEKSKIKLLISKSGLVSESLYLALSSMQKSGHAVNLAREILLSRISKLKIVKPKDKIDSKVKEMLSKFPKPQKSEIDEVIKLDDEYSLPVKIKYRPRKRLYATADKFYTREKSSNWPLVIMFDTLRKEDTTWSDLKYKITKESLSMVFDELQKFYTGEYLKNGWIGTYTKQLDGEVFLKINPTPDWNGEDVPTGGEERVNN